MFKCILLLSGALLLTGCFFSPEYSRPANVAETSFVVQPGMANNSLTMTDMLSDDQVLMSIIQHALSNNHDLQVSRVKAQTLMTRVNSSILDYIPAVSLGASKNISMSAYNSPLNNATLKQKTKNYQSSLSVSSYEVDIWGKKFNEIMSLNDQHKASESELAAIRLTLVTEIAKNWYEAHSLIKSWHLINEKLSHVQLLEKSLLAADNAGRIDPMLVAKFVRGKTYDENYKLTIENEILNRINYIEYLSDYKSSDLNESNWRTLSGEYYLPEFSSGINSEVIFRRPDVIQAEMAIRSANGEIGMARAAMLPVFNLFASANHTSKSFNDVFSNLSDNWTLSPSVIIPIFNLPKHYTNLQLAKSQQSIAIIEYKKTIAQALLDIKDSVQEMAKGQKMLALNEAELARTHTLMNKADRLYQSGYGPIFSYYEAIDIHSNALLEQENIRRQQMSNTLILLKSIGG